MNTSELSAEFLSSAVLAHHISGSISFVVSALVCMLIIFDSDQRGRAYRKYLISLQVFSMLADVCLNAYTPFVQFNCRLLFADSALSHLYDMVVALMLYSACFFGVVSTYFLCVYYRRNMLLPRHTHFCFHGWKYAAFITSIQIYLFTVIGAIYYIVSPLSTPIEDIPLRISWVKIKPSFLVINNDSMNYPVLIFVIASPLLIFGIILMMLIQLIREIKHGMVTASRATKSYQTGAVNSLSMQGVVPSTFYVLPASGLFALHLYSIIVGPEAAAINHLASSISVLTTNVMSLHTFAHSLTILTCSPSYRRTIKIMLKRALFIHHESPTNRTVGSRSVSRIIV